jgi:hypothetical protein
VGVVVLGLLPLLRQHQQVVAVVEVAVHLL